MNKQHKPEDMKKETERLNDVIKDIPGESFRVIKYVDEDGNEQETIGLVHEPESYNPAIIAIAAICAIAACIQYLINIL